jgi:hypothetical protein
MFNFLDQMAIHAQMRRLRDRHGFLYDDSTAAQYVRGLLLTSPPFAGGSPGTVRDVRNGRQVPCPRREALVQTLTDLLVIRGVMYAQLIDTPWLTAQGDVRRAIQTIRQALKTFYPEHRNKKLWLAYEEVVAKIDKIPPDKYRRFQTDHRQQKVTWRRELAHHCFWIFRQCLPSRKAYPDDAIDHALADICIHLGIESGERIFVAGRIRKDRAAVRNAEMADWYFSQPHSLTDRSVGDQENA